VVAITDPHQNIVQSYSYDAYGKVTGATGNLNNPFQFVGTHGVLTDENGLYQMGARYYDPDMRRFAAEDPLGLAAGLNLYEYVRGDPLNSIDPGGTEPLPATIGPATGSDSNHENINYPTPPQRQTPGEFSLEVVSKLFMGAIFKGSPTTSIKPTPGPIGLSSSPESLTASLIKQGYDLVKILGPTGALKLTIEGAAKTLGGSIMGSLTTDVAVASSGAITGVIAIGAVTGTVIGRVVMNANFCRDPATGKWESLDQGWYETVWKPFYQDPYEKSLVTQDPTREASKFWHDLVKEHPEYQHALKDKPGSW
jgi:RHS repeat-associated protein